MTTPMPKTAAEFFGAMAESYDDLIRRCAPRYDEMLDTLLAQLPAGAKRVLELGCGTGNLTTRLLQRMPHAVVTVVDASREMTSIVTARTGGRVHAVTSRFEDLDLAPASFDLVTSSISLHHVVDKAALFKKVGTWLAPGGEMWFADQFAGATPAIHQRNWDAWLAFCRRDGGCSEEEIVQLVEHAAAHDRYVSVAEHFGMLTVAGFDPSSLDCVWRNLLWGIVGARRT